MLCDSVSAASMAEGNIMLGEDGWGRGGGKDGQGQELVYLGAGHAPLGGAVHEGGEGHAACALLVPLAEELLLQLVGPPLVGARGGRQVPNVSTLQHHLH